MRTYRVKDLASGVILYDGVFHAKAVVAYAEADISARPRAEALWNGQTDSTLTLQLLNDIRSYTSKLYPASPGGIK